MFTKIKIEKSLDKILYDNDTDPSITDKKWINVDSSNCSILILPQSGKRSKKFKITQKMINQMKEYNKLYQLSQNYKYDVKKSNIAKIYAVVDSSTNHYYVGYTTLSVSYSIKINLSRYYRETSQTQSILFSFMNIKGLDVIILEYLKDFTQKDLNDRKKHYEDVLNKKDIKDYSVTECLEKFKNHYNDIVKPFVNSLKKFDATIYEIVNNNNNKMFICYSTSVLNEKDYDSLIDAFLENRQDINADRDDMSVIVLAFVSVLTKLQLELLTDSYILEKNAIEDGYNTDYLMFDDDSSVCCDNNKFLSIRRIMFGKIQLEIFYEQYKDDTNYNKVIGFVYMITNIVDGKKYISYENYDAKEQSKKKIHNQTLKDVVGKLYEEAMFDEMNEKKTINPLGKDLLTYPNNSFDVQILLKRTTRSRFNIKLKTLEYINKYHSNIDGYNKSINFKQKAIIGKKCSKK
jgi:hypothetical protein